MAGGNDGGGGDRRRRREPLDSDDEPVLPPKRRIMSTVVMLAFACPRQVGNVDKLKQVHRGGLTAGGTRGDLGGPWGGDGS